MEEGGNELFARIGYRAMNNSGRMFTQTVDCPIRPLPDWHTWGRGPLKTTR